MTDGTVLVIDDEPQIRRAIRNAFAGVQLLADLDDHRGDQPTPVRVLEAGTGRDGIDAVASEAPTLVVLDLGLPDMQGLDVCREIRRWSQVPIIVLSARYAESEKVALLDAGADDYMTKPFSTAELIARARAQLRRNRLPSSDSTAEPMRLGDAQVDLVRRRLERDGELVHLTRTEWALLRAFVTHPGQTLTHRQLFQLVWNNSSGDAQQYLRVYVGHLRRKIEADPARPRFLLTEPGIGYRFEPPSGES